MEEEEEPEVKFLDRQEYYDSLNVEPLYEFFVRWPEEFQENDKKWHKKVSREHDHIVDEPILCFRIFTEYLKILNENGLEATILRQNEPVVPNFVALRDPNNTFNLPLILEKFAELYDAENFVYYVNTVLAIRMEWLKPETDPIHMYNMFRMRITDVELLHRNYHVAIENHLSSCPLLRTYKFRKNKKELQKMDRDFIMTAHETMLALQTILGDWRTRIQGEKIVQITHANTLQLRAVRGKTDSLTVLTEGLICAIALERPVAQEELEEMDCILSSKTKSKEAKKTWGHWKTISSMTRNRENPQANLVKAQRLEDDAVLAGDECAVLVETACRARAQCEGQNERIIEVISQTIDRCPSLGPRMINLAVECNLGYETDQLLQTLVDTNDLHPSEPIWLVVIEKRLSNIAKYGSIEATLKIALKVMFGFLDYDANRFNESAWHLMKRTLEFTEPSFVAKEWIDRRSWWIRYHRTPCRDGRKMGQEAEIVKMEVLEALFQYRC